MGNLRTLAFGLDHEVGQIKGHTDTLIDVETLLCQLNDKMFDAEMKGEEKYCYKEHHRTIRILWHVVRQLQAELNDSVETFDKINTDLFDEVVKNGEKRQ
ncbi:hypothetical protein [Bacillus paranthracis]|uniref:hypothetical protein n=1 Tax=Bacillus paranthracis TaxID=2026186 RepID=UPI0002B8D2ED|nr:hypothetical protein [Bacillus paranthracis]MCC2439736.1 hypothetical protein [Bacillus paranthracis]MDG1604323.1 hypothetical protein [Bacillus paranthracis]RGO15535.1 hypothetical protein DXB28_23470 [Bacillus cereus]